MKTLKWLIIVDKNKEINKIITQIPFFSHLLQRIYNFYWNNYYLRNLIKKILRHHPYLNKKGGKILYSNDIIKFKYTCFLLILICR